MQQGVVKWFDPVKAMDLLPAKTEKMFLFIKAMCL